MMILRRLALLPAVLASLALAACASVPERQPQPQPQSQIFVAAAHPLAAEAGMDVLRKGGSAVDAAVAVQAMLSLVEPQSSGLGGGAFLVHFDAAEGKVSVLDGRETAPAAATPDMFLGADGKPVSRATAMLSGRATGVPGVVAMLKKAHDEKGALPWAALFETTAQRAEQGFTVTKRLERFIHGDSPQAKAPDVTAYFRGARAGDTIRNPAYAAFVRRLAEEGSDAFYRGPTAERIVARTRTGPLPGSMTLADLAGYTPVAREPLCGTYRLLLVCTPPPPASGVGLLQMLAILERTDIADRGPNDPQAWFLFAEASRLMYADRDALVGDPAFVNVPVKAMLDPSYVAGRAALIGPAAGPAPRAGIAPTGADATQEPAGTSHFVVVDARGNAVSMTTTVESFFGSGRMVDGFFLNNQMTDFSLRPEGPNAIAPGKRPRSSMTPLIALDAQGRFAAALGSPGGNAILGYVGKTLVGLVDWDLSMQQAIALPNLVARGNAFNGEAAKMPPAVTSGLKARGITVVAGSGEDSGLHGVIRRGATLDGGADPRRDGVARAEAAQ
ncbi:gamma-glutamyltransferase [Sphingomonas sp. LY54]|uniref:gamma-glutamyltransferase n=1 Tax=Sphingomonas sp. LY54 TaxID=3095343 RepID=UPI002D768FCC|nr:gamma-glutamyltransferase [Sphingomonas sp. LY54]WRP29961.1 gamma-glutamyltransferase [Sphingomonas sp. LY54]